MEPSVRDDIVATWEAIGGRFAAYSLVLPGDPAFACLADACPAHCCRLFSVSLGEREASRLARASGLPRSRFLETDEHGEPIVLPLAQPLVLARRDGACALLSSNLLCGQYEGRPDACRLYPHFVLAFDRTSLRPVNNASAVRAAAARLAAGELDAALALVVARHNPCPGFVGPPLAPDAWRILLLETTALQYPLPEPAPTRVARATQHTI